MKHEAVIFDLFGTLVHDTTKAEGRRMYAEMAAILSAPAEDVERLWLETYPERVTGAISSVEDNVALVCERLGLAADHTQIERASALRAGFIAHMLRPRADAVETLAAVKLSRRRAGLLSNCTPEVPGLWPGTGLGPFFDATVFSSEVGLRKPDPRIFELACERLRVRPSRCLYAADGDNGELEAADALGMSSVCVRYDGFDATARLAPEDFDGPTVGSLREILPLLE